MNESSGLQTPNYGEKKEIDVLNLRDGTDVIEHLVTWHLSNSLVRGQSKELQSVDGTCSITSLNCYDGLHWLWFNLIVRSQLLSYIWNVEYLRSSPSTLDSASLLSFVALFSFAPRIFHSASPFFSSFALALLFFISAWLLKLMRNRNLYE